MEHRNDRLLFHTFASQEERRAFGGSDFLELQYGRSARGAKLKELISVDAISHWKTDSLYVSGDDIDLFYSNYHTIFDHGIYNNGKRGVMDVFGLNYYPPESIPLILERVNERRPLDYEQLLWWFSSAEPSHGFYILGV